jgi:OOP family OmpA-OmpF porin
VAARMRNIVACKSDAPPGAAQQHPRPRIQILESRFAFVNHAETRAGLEPLPDERSHRTVTGMNVAAILLKAHKESVMHKLWTAVAALLVLVAGPALAQNNEGPYVGAGLGDFSSDIENFDDVADADIDFDSDEDASRIIAGWRFNRFLAVQLDYTDFGESRGAVNQLDITSDTKGLAPSVVGTLPIGPIELFGRAGVLFYDVEVDTPGGRLIDSSGEDAVLGAGIGFTLFERLNLTAEYERVDIEEFDDADAVWITASWRF